MEKDKKDKTPRQLGKAAAEAHGSEELPSTKRWKEARKSAVDNEGDGSGEEYYSDSRENSKMIRGLMQQLGSLQKTVMERLPERKGT